MLNKIFLKNGLKAKKDFLVSALIFVFLMSVYLLTMPLSITTEDSGELAAAAVTLGIPHPSGYPLWTILGHLFTFLPFGPLVWRLNLLSAVCGALTCVLIYLILRRLSVSRLIAAASGLLLGFSYTFWTQSVYAKFYTLNTFLICALILILLAWQNNRQSRWLYLFSLVYGLALTNHTMSVLLAPAFTFFIIWHERDILRKPLKIAGMFLLFCSGLSVYFYLLWRGMDQIAFVWTPIGNLTQFLGHILRWQYGDLSPLTSQYSKIAVVISFFLEISLQFFLPTLFLAVFGAWVSLKKDVSQFVILAGVFLLNSFGIIYLRAFGYAVGLDYTYRVYYLPAFCMVAVFFGLALDYCYSLLPRIMKNFNRHFQTGLKVIFLVLVLSIPLNFLVMNYAKADRSDYWLGYDYAKSVLASLEPNGVYYFNYDYTLQGDTEIFNLVYLKKVENFRPDVLVVSDNNFFRKEVNLHLPDQYFDLSAGDKLTRMIDLIAQAGPNKPIYTNFPVTLSETAGKYFSVPNGITFKVYKGSEQAKKAAIAGAILPIRNLSGIDEYSDLPGRGLAAHCYYNLAAYALVLGDDDLSKKYLNLATRLDPAKLSHEYKSFLTYRFEWENGDLLAPKTPVGGIQP